MKLLAIKEVLKLKESNYGVLKCNILNIREQHNHSPHFHIHCAGDMNYRVAINVRSSIYPSEVLYYIEKKFRHPITSKIIDFPFGFTDINDDVKTKYGLDYLRGKLFNKKFLKPIASQLPGPNNDLNEKIYDLLSKGINNKNYTLYVFGKRWGPEGKDKVFNFSPGNGIHDIHMNQGNVNGFDRDDSAYNDGGLLIHIMPENRWIGVFIAFQSQSFRIN